MAGSAQGIRAGRAFVELFADDTKLVRGLRAAERKLKAFGSSVQTMGNPTTKAALAMELFGKSGTSLLPMMQDGVKGIQELRDQARDLGLVISTEDAKAAEIFGDRLSDLWKVIKSGVFARSPRARSAGLVRLLGDTTKTEAWQR